MQFRDFDQLRGFIERQVLSYTAILLHLPYHVEESNLEEAIKLVPAQWMDEFVADVYEFDPNSEWSKHGVAIWTATTTVLAGDGVIA